MQYRSPNCSAAATSRRGERRSEAARDGLGKGCCRETGGALLLFQGQPDPVKHLPLSPADLTLVQSAFAAFNAGDLAAAEQALASISPAGATHPDAMFIASQVLIARGRLAEARELLDSMADTAPMNPHVWNAIGNLCSAEANPGGAAQAYARAASLDSAGLEFWLNLASAHIDNHAFTAALEALDRAERLTKAEPRQWVLRGLAERGRGANQAAIDAYCRALDIDPGNVAARHNFAEALRSTGEQDEALLIIGNGADLPEVTRNLRAHMLADLGRFDEAVATYRQVIATQPELVDASASLAQLLPQLGRAGEALDGFRQALAQRGDDRNLWIAAIASAKEHKQPEQLLEWCGEWDRRFGADPAVALARGIGQSLAGDRTGAIDTLQAVLKHNPEAPGTHAHLAPLLLAEGDWEGGEAHALEASRLAPLDQSGWAWLSIAWRLKDDAREEWLADYERLVMPIDLELEPEFITALAGALHKLHITSTHPANQSLRSGTQTSGILFDRPVRQVQQLAASIKSRIMSQLAGLTPDLAHPFLSRLSTDVDFAGSWSVRLASAGYHTAHIHHMGWLSSACYIALPPEVAAPDPAADLAPGSLLFGVPDAALGLDLTPRRTVLPKVGQLVLFPSYFWHGTAPFESASPRMSVAFDALPAMGIRH